MRHAPLAVALLLLASAAPAAEDALQASAQGGDVAAMVRLGFEYREGLRGRASNDVAAFEWFSKAAEAGNPRGLDNAAFLLENGRGTRRDPARARALYRQAADLGNPEAQSNLARCLHDGIGGARDEAAAFDWALRAYRNGETDRAAGILMTILVTHTNLLPHRALLDELGRARSEQAMLRLAHVYHEGLGGIGRDPAQAGIYFERARQYGLQGESLTPDQIAALSRRPRQPGRFAFLSMRHVEQGYNMCAPTAAAMALGYYHGTPPDPYTIKANSTGATEVGTGTAWDHLMIGVHTVSGRRWTFRSFPLSDAGFDEGLPVLRDELDAGRPPLIDLGPHTVVLCGYDAEQRIVYILNPAYPFPGLHTLTYDQLRERWHSPGHLSTTRTPARPMLFTGAPPGGS